MRRPAGRARGLVLLAQMNQDRAIHFTALALSLPLALTLASLMG